MTPSRVIRITDPCFAMTESVSGMSNEKAYKVFRMLTGGEVYVTSRDSLEEAKHFVAEFMDCWPGDYAIRGPKSFNLSLSPRSPSFTQRRLRAA
jgi:hypothetical protein